MKILGDKILVKVASSETVSEGGIILTTVKAERKYEGVVEEIGDHEDIKNLGIKVGDYVFYVPGMNTEINKDDEIYDVVSIYDVIGVGEED